jgi:NDP-sugar pyrophosphorylase family protein
MQCVILAGGLGTRMRPLTDTIPKTLLPVRGRPFAYYQMHWLASQGVTEVVYSIGHRGEMIRQYWEQEASPIPSLCFVDEGEQLRGTGGALSLAREQGVLEDRFLVIYGDSFLPVRFAPIWQAFEASGLPALMTVLRNRGLWDRSNASYQDGRVLLYNKAGGPDMEYIDYGLSAFRREVLDGWGGPSYDLANVLHDLSVKGRLAGFEVDRRFYEIGSPAGLRDFEQYLEHEEIIVTS